MELQKVPGPGADLRRSTVRVLLVSKGARVSLCPTVVPFLPLLLYHQLSRPSNNCRGSVLYSSAVPAH